METSSAPFIKHAPYGNTLVVQEGQSVQAAVTAAAAFGATVADSWLVLACPGVSRNYTEAAGVHVAFLEDLAREEDLVLSRVTQTLASGENYPHGSCVAAGYLWIGLRVTPAKLLRFNDVADLSDYDVLTMPTLYGHADALAYSEYSGKLYVAGYYAAGATKIQEIDPHTLERTEITISAGVASAASYPIACQGKYVYVAAAGNLWRYDLSTQTVSSPTTLTALNAHGMTLDDEHVFVASNDGLVARVNISDMTLDELVTYSLAAGTVGITDDLACYGEYVYGGLEDWSDVTHKDCIIRFEKLDLTAEHFIYPLPPAADFQYNTCYGVWLHEGYIYAAFSGGYASGDGYIARFDPQTGECISKRLDSGETDSNEILFWRGNMIVACFTIPAKIVRIPLPAFDADSDVIYPGNSTAATGRLSARPGTGGFVTRIVETTFANNDVPTDAELDGAFGTPATLGDGFYGIAREGDHSFICWTSNAKWLYQKGTVAS